MRRGFSRAVLAMGGLAAMPAALFAADIVQTAQADGHFTMMLRQPQPFQPRLPRRLGTDPSGFRRTMTRREIDAPRPLRGSRDRFALDGEPDDPPGETP